MICGFITRTNQANIKSYYIMNTIIICYLSCDRNIPITLTFVNQCLRCCAFILFTLDNYPHKSHVVFHIDYNILHNIMVVPYSTNKLYHVKRMAISQHKPLTCIDCRINHLCSYRDKHVLTIVYVPF
jgi:hypothetical protein